MAENPPAVRQFAPAEVIRTGMLLIAAVAQFGVLYAGNTGNLWLFMAFAFINGFGGGAFYPLFAALVPDYFGENNNPSNYGAKLVGGIGGGGLAAGVVVAWGYTGAYVLAGCIALLSAVLTLLLRQPGRPRAEQPEEEVSPVPGGLAVS